MYLLAYIQDQLSVASQDVLNPNVVFVTLCGASSALFGVCMLLFRHMLKNDERKTATLEEVVKQMSAFHTSTEKWQSHAGDQLENILDKLNQG